MTSGCKAGGYCKLLPETSGGGMGVGGARLAGEEVGSVSSRECLDALAILVTFTAGRTGLVIV